MISLSRLKDIKEELERLNKGGFIQVFLPAPLYFFHEEQRDLDLSKYKGIRYIIHCGWNGESLPRDAKELIERCNKAGIRILVIPALPETEEYIREKVKELDM
jgi:hypothetical protein